MVFESPIFHGYSWQANGLLFRRNPLLIKEVRLNETTFNSIRFVDGKYWRSTMIYARNLGILLMVVMVLSGCELSINSPVVVPDGESRVGLLTTVNGDVTIGKDCTIEGSSTTVNGSINVGDGSIVEDLNAVNGLIRVGKGVSVQGNIESVNGLVELGAESEVSGNVGTVNGAIELDTVNGDIELRNNSVVKGDVVIKDKADISKRQSPIEIKVTGGSIIEGDVVVKRNVDVRLILSDGGKVLGQVEGAEIITN
jgi:hypothetical protein